MGLSTTKENENIAQETSGRGTPPLIVKDAKSLSALVTTAMNPKSVIARKRVANAVLTAERLQHLPIEPTKKVFSLTPN